MNNPLLSPFQTPYETLPFDKIRPEDFEPAILASIKTAENDLLQIIQNKETPDFENTIVALEKTGRQLNLIETTLSNLCSAETNDTLDFVSEKMSPILTKFYNDISLNEHLFKRVNFVFEQVNKEDKTTEELRLLDKTYKSFVRNGALLPENEKEKLRKIDEELSVLKIKFGQNVLKATNDYALNLTQESQLEGLPQSMKNQAQKDAVSRKQTGWTFTLQLPSYLPFMKFIKDRRLREEMYKAYGCRAFGGNEWNNVDNIRKIVLLRNQRAQLLGFKNHADFVLAERMAGNLATVEGFLNDLLGKTYAYGVHDVQLLKFFAQKDGIDDLKPFDHAYYAEKLRESKFNYSEESVKPYFPLEQVLQAAFNLAFRLYGLVYKERKDIPVYHQEVRVFEVNEGTQFKGILYVDLHPRVGKRPGAWMTDFRGQYKDSKGNHRPHLSIVCNFSRPNGTAPALLTFNEVTTLFHEFGHSLHGILADTVFESLSGTHVYWDFVELPSQFMENFCSQKEFLRTFAKHYKTGEILPDSEMDKLISASNFMEGYQTLRQLSFGLLDMAYHTGELGAKESIEDFEERIMKPTELYPKVEGTAMSPSFGHIFSGGYAAGYYSYKWSEILDADAFSLFKETGIFNPATASKFKTLLSKGGTEDPMKLFIAFRGRKPSIEPLLERAGMKG